MKFWGLVVFVGFPLILLHVCMFLRWRENRRLEEAAARDRERRRAEINASKQIQGGDA